jgi:hypothetical protein
MSSSFYPTRAPKNLSATEASQVVKLTEQQPQLDITVRVQNTGTKPVYLNFGENSDVSASSTTGMVVMPLVQPELFNLPENQTHLAYACASGDTSTLQVVLGRKGK